jgi:hypothetical protein
MSYSDFKEQKSFNFRTAFLSGFSVEAADNLSNPLIESTAFRKNIFEEQPVKSGIYRTGKSSFERAGHSSDLFGSRNPKIKLFSTPEINA